MHTQFKKTIIKISFDVLVDQLQVALLNNGFVLCGVTDLQKEYNERLNMHYHKHKVLSVDLPRISSQMIAISSQEGNIMPANISVIEVYPGEIVVVQVNPTQLIADVNNNDQLLNLARTMSDAIDEVISTMESNTEMIPDLVTSWG